MAVTVGNGTVTPVVGTETDVATIAPGTPLDNLTVYVVGGTGGGGGSLEFALYATVGGFRTRVAQKEIMGSDTASIIDFDTGLGPLSGGSGGAGQTEQVDAGGTNYTITVIDLSTRFVSSPRNPVSVTIAAVDSFDTAPDQNFGTTFALAPSATGTLPLFNGYAQLMDVAIDQTNLPPVTVEVTADCGLGSVQAVVVSVDMTGRDETIASVFRGIKLPVATRYFVSVTNNTRTAISTTLTGVTYSVSITAGGAVILNGDVIGPSPANTVIKWDNVPLLLGGPPGFGAPVDAAIPIYNAGLNLWRTFALSGDATMTDAGVVTVTGGTVTLTGNVNGPSNANRWTSLVLANTVGAPVTTIPFVGTVPGDGWWYVAVTGVTVNRTVNLPGAPTAGEVVVITDESGFLVGANTITVNGAPNDVEGVSPFVMNATYPGEFGSICLQFDGANWFIFADYAPNATVGGVVTLAGNANGPSNANHVEDFGIESVNANVTAAQFTPIAAGEWYVGISGQGVVPGFGNVSVQLQDTFPPGSKVTVKDEDGSLANVDFLVTGSTGKTIDGLATFIMNLATPGPKGSITFEKNFNGPNEWAVV